MVTFSAVAVVVSPATVVAAAVVAAGAAVVASPDVQPATKASIMTITIRIDKDRFIFFPPFFLVCGMGL